MFYRTHDRAGLRFTWVNSPCNVLAQINAEGQVAIVHDVGNYPKTVKGRVALDTGTYFRVLWDGDGSFPDALSSCGSCELHESTCVCPTQVSTERAFDGTTFPSLEDIQSQLLMGAPDPSMFDAGIYHVCSASICTSNSHVIIHTRGTGPINADGDLTFDTDTIFEIPLASGSSRFLSNTVSTVNVGDGTSFRNPPMLNSPLDQTKRDGLYEIDLILDHYFRHSNVAPFIATRLIQLLTTSNPTPRYVYNVAEAFLTGYHSADELNFGTGDYGDLAAVVAAIFTDREARSNTLLSDATHGSAREPLLKIMHYTRSMELDSAAGQREVNLIDLQSKLGQEAYNAPSVFSFFLPEFQPVGPVIEKGLVSPEAQVFDAPKLGMLCILHHLSCSLCLFYC